jgi:outer membrane protein TolC
LEYNLLTEKPNAINSFATQEYKGGVSFRMPLFLRKERGDLKLAKLKLKEAALELESAHVKVRNEVTAIYRELESYETQKVLIEGIVNDNRALVAAEERKFSFGESSLFLINSRESKLIDAKLKQNEVRFKFFSSKAKLFQSLAVNPENL